MSEVRDKTCERCGRSFRGNTDSQPCPACSVEEKKIGVRLGRFVVAFHDDLPEGTPYWTCVEDFDEGREPTIKKAGTNDNYIMIVGGDPPDATQKIEYLCIGHSAWPDPLVVQTVERAMEWYEEYKVAQPSIYVDRVVSVRSRLVG